MHINDVSEHDSSSMLIKLIWNSAQDVGIANKSYYQTVSSTKCGN